MNKITDLLSLTATLRTLAESLPDVAAFVALGNGEDALDEISTYYNEQYAGPTVFLQVAELPLDRRSESNPTLTFACSLTVALKPDSEDREAKLWARNEAFRLMMKLIGQLDLLADEQGETSYRLSPGEKLFPIGAMANVSLQGYYVDLDVRIPANSLLYSAD